MTEAVSGGAVRSRQDLRDRLDAAGCATNGQALVHVLLAASLRGRLLRGPVVDGEQASSSPRDWLGEPPPELDRDEALGRLAARYLAGHGPADAQDLARWAGVTLGDARRGIAAQRPGCASGRTGWSNRPAGGGSPDCRRRGCSERSTRCCSAGSPATRSSARTGRS